MKFAIISDLHVGIKKSSDVYMTIVKDFFHKQLYPYLQKNEITDIFILGDVFDTRESINVKAMNFVYDLFSKSPFHYTILVGNHDLFYNNSRELTSLKMLNNLSNVTIINNLTTVWRNEVPILLCPWIIDDADLHVAIKETEAKICFGHFDIAGFNYTSKLPIGKSIQPDTFSKFDKVFSGHFHTRESRIINNTEIIYVGCPYELTRADIGNPKGFHIFDTETSNYEFIENTVSPKHIQIKYPEMLDDITIASNFVDVFVDEKDLQDDDKIKEYLKRYNSDICLQPADVKIIKADDYLDDDLKLDNEAKSIIDLITDYINLQKVIDNKKEVINLLNEVYEESLK